MQSSTNSEQTLMEWQVHLALLNPFRTFIVICITAFIIVCALIYLQSIIMVTIIGLVFLTAISEYLFPIRYKLTDTGVYISNFMNKKSIRWQDIRKCYLDSDGIKLQSSLSKSRFRSGRGVYIYLDSEKRDEIISQVKQIRKDKGDDHNT